MLYIYSITMKNTSLDNNTTNTNNKASTFQFLFLFDMFFIYTNSKWVCSRFKFFTRFHSFLRSILAAFVESYDHSNIREDKKLVAELSPPEHVCVDKKLSDDGKLNREDAKMVMGKLGFFCSSENNEELPEWFSSNEFSELFEEKEPSLEELKEAFDVFDENRDGFIDAEELQSVLCLLGLNEAASNLENCQQMIRNFDQNKDGRIDFIEFAKFMETNF